MDRPLEVTRQLRSGERVLWAGQPDPAVVFTGADLFLIPFSVVFLGVVTVMGVTAAQQGNVLFAIVSSIFFAIGLFQLVGRFVLKAVDKRRTFYVITDERVMAVRGRSVTDAPASRLKATTTHSRSGSHVTIVFGAPMKAASRFRQSDPTQYANTGMDVLLANQPRQLAFYDVADVERLTAALRVAREV